MSELPLNVNEYLWADLNSEKSVAKALGVSPSTLFNLRKAGLPYLRVGGRVFFHQPTAVKWIVERCHVSRDVAANEG